MTLPDSKSWSDKSVCQVSGFALEKVDVDDGHWQCSFDFIYVQLFKEQPVFRAVRVQSFHWRASEASYMNVLSHLA